MTTNTQDTLLKIHQTIQWLEINAASQDIDGISIKLNELAIYSMYFADSVSDAYAVMEEEDESYNNAVATYVSTSDQSAAKAEREAETKYVDLRKNHIESKKLQRKFRTKLDRIDKILDHFKQRISVVKQAEMKNI